ncbi:hypothetical protein SAMN05421856_101433 [Chryseobacterium taichungense]|uniref:Uncharacterized protein n=1 Tax=Chryseobacterium taichungense TaxID=295069 RepID=A0A1H7W375_9FLAO|nr:hypothetical protein [Chryseobacterium taichungense]SEM15448.1 hypothetical protein SAMN05421856_101433 [Chryseobacterium taichungense]
MTFSKALKHKKTMLKTRVILPKPFMILSSFLLLKKREKSILMILENVHLHLLTKAVKTTAVIPDLNYIYTVKIKTMHHNAQDGIGTLKIIFIKKSPHISMRTKN